MRLSKLPLWGLTFCPLLVASCSPAAALRDGNYTIATAAPETDVLSIFDGTVQAQQNADGTACWSIAWRSTHTAIIWPAGYTARGNPLAVYDGRGKQVVVAGETLSRTLLQPSLGWGQVLSRPARNVEGCSGFSQSVTFVPTASRKVATPGPVEYDDFQIGQMQSAVDTYRDVFSGLVGDPTSHVVTVYIASTADPASVAQAKAWLLSAAGASNGYHSLDHWLSDLLSMGQA